jgi:hypothetical protein
MNAKRISLALATLALLSTGSAFAQSVDVQAGPVDATVTTAPAAGVSVGPVGVGVGPFVSPVKMGTRLFSNIFNPPRAWFELSVLGAGIKIGETEKKVVQVGATPSASLLVPSTLATTEASTMTFARVVPGSVSLGAARPVHARVEAPNPMAHFDLFGKRLFGVGRVHPSLDMRH